MTKPLLSCLWVALGVAFLPCASAQTPSPPAQEAKPDAPAADNNYVLTLYSPADKRNGPEMAVILALFPFDKVHDAAETQVTFDLVNSAQPHLHFRGTLLPQKDGRYLLNYLLECAGDTAGAALLLRPGEPVQMIKSGDLYFNLRLERYNPLPARP